MCCAPCIPPSMGPSNLRVKSSEIMSQDESFLLKSCSGRCFGRSHTKVTTGADCTKKKFFKAKNEKSKFAFLVQKKRTLARNGGAHF